MYCSATGVTRLALTRTLPPSITSAFSIQFAAFWL